ncbi:MAG TPA: hypothetical protein VIL03_05895 [Clostridia bacterium]|jgi:hypothetical protein
MRFIKWVIRSILGLVAFFGVAVSISVPLVPLTIFATKWLGWKVSLLSNLPWWTPYALAALGGLAVTALIKSLPIIRNFRKFIAEAILFGGVYGGLFYVSRTYFNHYLIVPKNIMLQAYNLTKFGFIPTVFSNNAYTMLVGAGLLAVFLLIFFAARALRNPNKIKAKLAMSAAKGAHTTAPTNVVSSADGKIADYKVKKYVRDIWGNYIEEDDYNARINEIKNRKL